MLVSDPIFYLNQKKTIDFKGYIICLIRPSQRFIFFQSTLSVFNRLNLFLQADEPLIHSLYDHIISFLKKFLSRFIRAAVLKQSTDILIIEYTNIENQLNDTELFIGMTTRQQLNRFIDDGSISHLEYIKFLKG